MEAKEYFKTLNMGLGEVLHGFSKETGEIFFTVLEEGKGLPIGTILDSDREGIASHEKYSFSLSQSQYIVKINVVGQLNIVEQLGCGLVYFPHGVILYFNPQNDNTASIQSTRRTIEQWLEFEKAKELEEVK